MFTKGVGGQRLDAHRAPPRFAGDVYRTFNLMPMRGTAVIALRCREKRKKDRHLEAGRHIWNDQQIKPKMDQQCRWEQMGNSKLSADQTSFLIIEWLCPLPSKYFAARQSKKEKKQAFHPALENLWHFICQR